MADINDQKQATLRFVCLMSSLLRMSFKQLLVNEFLLCFLLSFIGIFFFVFYLMVGEWYFQWLLPFDFFWKIYEKCIDLCFFIVLFLSYKEDCWLSFPFKW